MSDDDLFTNFEPEGFGGSRGNIPVNPDATSFIKPSPGGRRPPKNASRQSTNSPPSNESRPRSVADLIGASVKTDINQIMSLARPLLSVLTSLSQTHQHPNVNDLHSRTVQEIQNFVTNAQQQGIHPQQIQVAKYILCAALDETVLNTPWGSNSQWPGQTLQSIFHKENTGGEKLFTIMDRLSQNPAANIDLLELIAVCLALGFMGKYRVVNGGWSHVENIRIQLYQQIVRVRGEYERELSPHIQTPLTRHKRSAEQKAPVWMIGAVTIAVIISIFVGFEIALTKEAQPVLDKLNIINPSVETQDAL